MGSLDDYIKNTQKETRVVTTLIKIPIDVIKKIIKGGKS